MTDIDNDLYRISDYSHMGWGALFVYIPFIFFGGWVAACIGAAIIVILSAFKEAVIDPREETPELAGSGWRDWAGYCLGAGLAILSLYIKILFLGGK